jgi:hypothetical protein
MALPVNTSTVPKTLPLLHGNVTLESALDNDDNMLQKIAYPDLRFEFYLSLYKRRSDIEAIVSHHLRLRQTETCHLGEFKDWKAGSFNVCIPVNIRNWDTFPNKRVIIRFPLPYKVGESRYPGNADEKLRCEAASFIWIQDNCPAVPIPYLWGFGFSDGQGVCISVPLLKSRAYAHLFIKTYSSLTTKVCPFSFD